MEKKSSTMDAIVPDTPQKPQNRANANIKIKWIVDHTLNFKWDLALPVPKEGDSPQKRSAKPPSIKQEIVFKLSALSFRDLIDPLIIEFEITARQLYSGWVNKPKAERGVLPERSRHTTTMAVTDNERGELHQCLLGILNRHYMAMTPKRQKRLPSDDTNPTGSQSQLDDSPVPFSLVKPKRSMDQTDNEDTAFKKPKLPQLASGSFSRSFGSNRLPSFASDAPSIAPSIFSNSHLNASNRSLLDSFTQETIPSQATQSLPDNTGIDMNYREASAETSFEGPTVSSSDYGAGCSFDADLVCLPDGPKLVGIGQSDPVIDDELSQDMSEQAAIMNPEDLEVRELGENEIRERLHGIFPELPVSLRALLPCAAYEITRVFLHAGVSLDEVQVPPTIDLADYNSFWTFLRSLPVLRGKPFPERCSREAWDSTLADSRRTSTSLAAYMTGSLHFNYSLEPGSLFRLRLNALRLDASHRSGRRFGHDRFLELDIPDLTGRRVPKCLQLAGKVGPESIVEWLVDGCHRFINRVWKPFHIKPKERRERKVLSAQRSAEPEPTHRIFFFAVDGIDFADVEVNGLDPQPHAKMSVDVLLNRIRPTRKNTTQPFLKLFSRTSLALSRNTPTFVLERHQIREKPDIYYNNENMTDGAGRISPSLATKVAQNLGLSYTPSGFQARIGEAKGFWSVDLNDKGGEDWVDVYKSQCKWTRSSKRNGESDHASHRTFEVLRFSSPLKSADLNLQLLPLLVDRAISPQLMKESISNLLVEGLNREIETLRTAMNSPQGFRKWVREINPNVTNRLRSSAVTFQAGLPTVLEERVSFLLEPGFDPRELYFLKDMARIVFKNKCDDLKKRLNITIGKSAYVYIIPDFAGVLEPDEVYLDFSEFTDNISGLSGPLLKDVNLLVSRSPAHYISDVQKVKAVVKAELMGLKDVIVFPTKGNPSLAARLSGGDYDGDIAWVCWEPTLVNNFENAEVQPTSDLVKEGYVRQDKTKYEDLVKGHANPISIFLKKSFAFNLQSSLLGICTFFKEMVCYTQKSMNTSEAFFLSTLLFLLVDWTKQGYIFEDEDWARIKREVIKFAPIEPLYKTDHIKENAEHIIDHLVYVASKTIDKKLTEFHDAIPAPPQWDEDLAAYYKWAREQAKLDPEISSLLNDLDADLNTLKASWSIAFGRGSSDESKSEFVPNVVEHHARFLAIVPQKSTLVSRWLSPDCFTDSEVTEWALLRASALFASYTPKYVPNFVWWMAGRQLAHLKAKQKGAPVAMTPFMHVSLKTDASFLRRMQNQGVEAAWEAPANEDSLAQLDAEDD